MHPVTKSSAITGLRQALARLGDAAPLAGKSAPQDRLPLDATLIDKALNGGLAIGAMHEVRCDLARDAASAAGFVLALLALLSDRRKGRILWLSDPALQAENIGLFPHAMAHFGIDPDRFILVRPADFGTAMWAAGEAVRCPELMACIFHIRANPPGLDLTTTRRLTLRTRQSGVFTCLLRQSSQAQTTSAATRWCIAAAPSPAPPGFAHSIGTPCFNLILERNRTGQLGHWTATWNHLTKSFGDVSTITPAHSVPCPAIPAGRPHLPAQVGQVVAFERTA